MIMSDTQYLIQTEPVVLGGNGVFVDLNQTPTDIDEESFYKQLFSVYDQDNTGYITLDKFMTITKENLSDNWKIEEEVRYFKNCKSSLIINFIYLFFFLFSLSNKNKN